MGACGPLVGGNGVPAEVTWGGQGTGLRTAGSRWGQILPARLLLPRVTHSLSPGSSRRRLEPRPQPRGRTDPPTARHTRGRCSSVQQSPWLGRGGPPGAAPGCLGGGEICCGFKIHDKVHKQSPWFLIPQPLHFFPGPPAHILPRKRPPSGQRYCCTETCVLRVESCPPRQRMLEP